MKAPISWLKEYVDLDASPREIAERLTFSGTEVESIKIEGSDYAEVVVAEIKAVEPHPDADRLSLCRVFDGQDDICVVCGAPNIRPGSRVVLAKPGARLPNGQRIKAGPVRGRQSDGMLCAEDELGLSEDHTGILVLDDVAPGTPFVEVAGPPETVLELEVTWNRADCLSMVGIAREMAALFDVPLKLPAVDFDENGGPVTDEVRVDIEDPQGCPRYTARVLDGVSIGPAPLWMRRRLWLCGVRPISNIVDITNYVMLECGQPLHAFDYGLVADRHIRVRRAAGDERMATLDGVTRDLSPEILVIADARRALAVAGIMGGEGSEIRDATSKVLLESACFDPADIHSSCLRLALQTESSHRFERGVDVENVEWASRRAAALMVAHAGAVAAQGVVDVYPRRPVERKVDLRFRAVPDLLGFEVEPEETVRVLESLGLALETRDAQTCSVRVPTFRGDLEIEADLIEEVARVVGLDRVPETAPQACLVKDADDSPTRAVDACRDRLVGLGLSEIVNYSFLGDALLERVPVEGDRVRLPNPVSREYAVMRGSLLPQMVETLGRNRARENTTAALFEIGRVFLPTEGGVGEDDRLAIGLMGPVGRGVRDRRRAPGEEEMFLWAKGLLVNLADSLRTGEPVFEPGSCACLDSDWCVSLKVGDGGSGVLGLLSEPVRADWRLGGPVAVAELSLAPILKGVFNVPALQPVAGYPSVSRDLALIVDDHVSHAEIVNLIRTHAPAELTEVSLFDIFRGEGIGQAKKSLAYSLVYRSFERTLTDEDANLYTERISETLRQSLGAEIREG